METKIELPQAIANDIYLEVLDLIPKNLSLMSTIFLNEEYGQIWSMEFTADDINTKSGLEIVGNVYLTEERVAQIKELVRIAKASKDELPGALASEDEIIRDAAEDRMYQIAEEERKLNRRRAGSLTPP